MGGKVPRRHSVVSSLQEIVAEPIIMAGLIAAG